VITAIFRRRDIAGLLQQQVAEACDAESASPQMAGYKAPIPGLLNAPADNADEQKDDSAKDLK
jgi:hypothetical protein